MYVHKTTEKFPLSLAMMQCEHFIWIWLVKMLNTNISASIRYIATDCFKQIQFIYTFYCLLNVFHSLNYIYVQSRISYIANHTQIAYLIFIQKKKQNKTNPNEMHSENEKLTDASHKPLGNGNEPNVLFNIKQFNEFSAVYGWPIAITIVLLFSLSLSRILAGREEKNHIDWTIIYMPTIHD